MTDTMRDLTANELKSVSGGKITIVQPRPPDLTCHTRPDGHVDCYPPGAGPPPGTIGA